MSRPSRNTDRRLLDAGLRLIPEHGVSGLSLRRVADEAEVNLGMFHYHFGSKDNFARQVLQEFYEGFFTRLEGEFLRPDAKTRPLVRLKAMLGVLGHNAQTHGPLIAALFRDLLAGDKVSLEFAVTNMPRHMSLMLQTIREAQKAKVLRADFRPEEILGLCISTLGIPAVASAAIRKRGPKHPAAALPRKFFTPSSVERRIDFLLQGLKP